MRKSSKRGLGLARKSSRTKRHDEDIDYKEQNDDYYDYPEDDYDDDFGDAEDDDYYDDDQEYERETDGIDDDEYDTDYDDDRDYYEEDDSFESDDPYEDEDDELYEGDEDYRNVEDIDAGRNYEHDEYDEDDEDYDDWHDRREGLSDDSGSGFFSIITESSAVERIAALIFVVLIAGAVATGVFYKKTMDKNHEISSFASVGANYGETEIVGESGLIAVADAQRAKLEAAQLISEDEENEEEENSEEEDKNASVNVSMSVTTIKSDIKIKFTNSKTGKLVASTPFTVTVVNPDGGSVTYDDHDQDGIIYKKDLTAGKYTVTPDVLSGEYEKYKIDTASKSVTVKNTVEMKAVDVTGEVKKESEVNVAKEDTAVADKVESALTDTVEWVESTKSEVSEGTDSGEGGYIYEVVDKSSIVDPSSSAMNGVGRFMFMAFAAAPEENSDNDEEEDKEFKVKAYDVTLKIGETSKIEIIDGPSELNYSSSDSDLVKVSEDGTISAVGEGVEYITITAEGYQKEVVKVIVKKEESASGSSSAGSSSTGSSSSSSLSAGSSSAGSSSSGSSSASSSSSSSDGAGSASSDNKTTPINIIRVTLVKGRTFKIEPKSTDIALNVSSADTGKVSVDGTTIKGEDTGETTVTVTADGYAEAKVTVTVKSNSEKLQTKDGKQVYIKDSEGNYIEADYGDYYIESAFYLRSGATSYKYTGWQTIDGKTYYFDKNGNAVTGEQVIQGAKYTFESDGAIAGSSNIMGIDVSKWNGNIDWAAVKNSGVNFVIIRCGYRGSSEGALIEDSKFKSNIKGAQDAGLKVGVYFFSQAVNEVEAVEEASMVISLIKGYSLSYPVYLDVEKSNGRGDDISSDQRTANIKAFCGTVANAGYSVGVYSNKTWFTEKMNISQLGSYNIWLAQYKSDMEYSASKVNMWQYTSKGKVSGISGNVDMNIYY